MSRLADFLLSYADQDDPHIQSKTAALYEFASLSTQPREWIARGDFYNHQKFVQRFMSVGIYDSIYFLHDPGVGKTCAVVRVVEGLRAIQGEANRGAERSLVFDPRTGATFPDERPRGFRGAIVILKNENLIEEFKMQTLCRCTVNEHGISSYETEAMTNSYTEKAYKSAATRSLHTVYKYWKFGSECVKLAHLTDQAIIEQFSDYIIIVDEVHNLKPLGDEDKVAYEQLARLFRLVRRCKKIVMSATPMVEKASEIKTVMNLVLPPWKQMPPELDVNRATAAELEPYFRGRVSYVRGFDTGATPAYQGEPAGDTYQTITYRVVMSPQQEACYRGASDDLASPVPSDPGSAVNGAYSTGGVNGGGAYPAVVNGAYSTNGAYPGVSGGGAYPTVGYRDAEAFHRRKIGAGNIAFAILKPGLNYDDERVFNDANSYRFVSGKRGFSQVFAAEHPHEPVNEVYRRVYGSMRHIRMMSAKAAFIIEEIQRTEGAIYIYSNLVTDSGTIGLSKMIEYHLGYSPFVMNRSVFDNPSGRSLCGSEEQHIRSRPYIAGDPNHPYHYALVSSTTTNTRAILQVMNSPENWNGDYLKVFIGSGVISDGINIHNVVKGFIFDPCWGPGTRLQVENRVFRATSHDTILKRRGVSRIEVPMYRLASYTSDGDSIDNHIYRMSEDKDRDIRRITRIMKRCAVDCVINRGRNQRPEDRDYTVDADFDTAHYEPFDNQVLPLDTTNYRVIATREKTGLVRERLVEYFSEHFTATLDRLYALFDGPEANGGEEKVPATRLLGTETSRDQAVSSKPPALTPPPGLHTEIAKTLVDYALSEMIDQRVIITNRHGSHCVLVQDRGLVSARQIYADHRPYYTAHPHYHCRTPLSKLLRGAQQPAIRMEVDRLFAQGDVASVATATRMVQAGIIESIIAQHFLEGVRGNDEAAEPARTPGWHFNTSNLPTRDQHLLYVFSNHLFTIREPLRTLALSQFECSRRARSSNIGRPRSQPKQGEERKKREINISLQPQEDYGERLVFHTIYNLHRGSNAVETAHDVSTKFMKIGKDTRVRVFKETEMRWRDATEAEREVYNLVYQQAREAIDAHFSQVFAQQLGSHPRHRLLHELAGSGAGTLPIYGSELSDGSFRIHDRNTEKEKAKTDGRGRNRGRVASTITNAKMAGIAYRLGIGCQGIEDYNHYVEVARHNATELVKVVKSTLIGMGLFYRDLLF
jgi:hypothetical protein